jgi:hypothetical protein
MGPAATTTAHPPVPRRPIIGSRPAASRTPDGAGFAGRAAPGPLTRTGPLSRIGSSRGTGQTTGPRLSSRPAGQSGMPSNAPKHGQNPVKPPLTRPRSFREDTDRCRKDQAVTTAAGRSPPGRPWRPPRPEQRVHQPRRHGAPGTMARATGNVPDYLAAAVLTVTTTSAGTVRGPSPRCPARCPARAPRCCSVRPAPAPAPGSPGTRTGAAARHGNVVSCSSAARPSWPGLPGRLPWDYRE